MSRRIVIAGVLAVLVVAGLIGTAFAFGTNYRRGELSGGAQVFVTNELRAIAIEPTFFNHTAIVCAQLERTTGIGKFYQASLRLNRDVSKPASLLPVATETLGTFDEVGDVRCVQFTMSDEQFEGIESLSVTFFVEAL